MPVYPCKGYSATLALLQPERAPNISLIDDECKIAVSRLGDQLRVAGTLELAGMDRALDTPLARARSRRSSVDRCRMPSEKERHRTR